MIKRIVIENDSQNFVGNLEGDIYIELKGVSNLKRIIKTIPGKRLKLNYLSKDSKSNIEDIIYVSENSELIYEGAFFSEQNEFVNKVKIIHEKPNGTSFVNIKGISKKDVEILTSGEIQKGAKGSKLSIKGLVVLFDKGHVKAIPEIKISEPSSKAYHSFKKMKLTSNQRFYLFSKGLTDKDIESFYKGAIIGD